MIEAASPIHPNSEDINLEDDPLSVWIRGKGERVPSGEGAVWPAGQGDLPLGPADSNLIFRRAKSASEEKINIWSSLHAFESKVGVCGRVQESFYFLRKEV